jgi:hypothetical protein
MWMKHLTKQGVLSCVTTGHVLDWMAEIGVLARADVGEAPPELRASVLDSEETFDTAFSRSAWRWWSHHRFTIGRYTTYTMCTGRSLLRSRLRMLIGLPAVVLQTFLSSKATSLASATGVGIVSVGVDVVAPSALVTVSACD